MKSILLSKPKENRKKGRRLFVDHHHECLSSSIFLILFFDSSHAVRDTILMRNIYFCLYDACQYSFFYTCNKNDNHFLFCRCWHVLLLLIHILRVFSDFKSSESSSSSLLLSLLFFVIIIISEHISLHIEKSSKNIATSYILSPHSLLSPTNKFLSSYFLLHI